MTQQKRDEETIPLIEESEQLRKRLDHCEAYFLEVSQKMDSEINIFQEVEYSQSYHH